MTTDNRKVPSRATFTLVCSVFAALVLVLFTLSASGLSALAETRTLKHDTVADFNPGTFYHTGLTTSTDPNNTGDGNGEIRLLNVGINPATWNQNGNVTGLPATGLWGHAAVYYNGRIYVSGGNDGSSGATNGVYLTTVNANHSLTSWSASSALPTKLYSHAMVQLNGYLYAIGGIDNLFAVRKTVYKAQIDAVNGTLGSWSATNDLPIAASDDGVYDTAVVVVQGRIYVIGGHDKDGGSRDTVFIGTQDGSGNITWTTSATTLPIAIAEHTATVSSNRIYVIGGFNNNPVPPVYSPDVYIGAPEANGDITTWTQDPVNMPNNLVKASSAAFADQIYAVGGAINTGGTPLNSILSNLVNDTDGSLASNWVTNNVLSSSRVQSVAVMTNDGWLYVIEGGSGTSGLTPLKTIDYGPTSSTGSCNVADNCAYALTGTFTSQPFDLGSIRPILQLRWNTSTVQNVTAVTMKYRFGDTLNALSSAAWQPVSPLSSTSGTKQTTIANISSSTGHYFQYQVALSTNDSSTTPIVNWVELDYDAPTPTPTPTNTPTNTPIYTNTPTNTVTNTPTATSTGVASSTPTNTATPTSVVPPSTTPTFTATPCKIKPAQPVQVSPGKNANLFVRAVPLAWQATNCGVKYKVIVRYTSKTGPVAFKRANITSLNVTTTRLDKAKTYVWKVRACNAIGCGKWSEWRTFKVTKQAK